MESTEMSPGPQVLAYSTRSAFKQVLEEGCKEIIGHRPVVKESLGDFQLLLTMLSHVDVLIIDCGPLEKEIWPFITFLEACGTSFKHLIVVAEKDFSLFSTAVFNPHQTEALMSHVARCLAPSTKPVQNYLGMPIHVYQHFTMLPFDLYVRIGQERYVKRIPAYEDIEQATLNQLRDRGIRELHFDWCHKREFSQLLINCMENSVVRDYALPEQKQIARSGAFRTTQDIIRGLGINPRIVNLCESIMGSMIEDMARGKCDFARYLKKIAGSKLGFHYRFVELTSYIAAQVVSGMEPFATSDYTRKMVFAAFFCDVTLQDPEWIHIRSASQVDGLSAAVVNEINSHARKAADMAAKYPGAPLGVDMLIRQHHGTLDGMCFTLPSVERLNPMSRCLVVSQELAYTILTNPADPLETSLQTVKAKYRHTKLSTLFTHFEKRCA